MKVILTADVKKVGRRGEVVVVADGFAQNVLLPKKQAVVATAENLKRHEAGVREAQGRADQNAAQAAALLKNIHGKELVVVAKMSDTGTLFKSVHESDIAAEIKKQWGIDIPEEALYMSEPIKKKGTYEVPVALLGAKATVAVVI